MKILEEFFVLKEKKYHLAMNTGAFVPKNVQKCKYYRINLNKCYHTNNECVFNRSKQNFLAKLGTKYILLKVNLPLTRSYHFCIDFILTDVLSKHIAHNLTDTIMLALNKSTICFSQ